MARVNGPDGRPLEMTTVAGADYESVEFVGEADSGRQIGIAVTKYDGATNLCVSVEGEVDAKVLKWALDLAMDRLD